jgi:hypothetical protein
MMVGTADSLILRVLISLPVSTLIHKENGYFAAYMPEQCNNAEMGMVYSNAFGRKPESEEG